jgi:hypothetical protein
VDNSAAERIYVMFLLLFWCLAAASATFSAVAAASVLFFPLR